MATTREGILGSLDSWILGSLDPWILGFLDSWSLGFLVAPGLLWQDSKTPRLQEPSQAQATSNQDSKTPRIQDSKSHPRSRP